MAFTEDLTVFFNDAEFSDEITRPDGSKFKAIFDETYFDPESGETVLDTTKPRLTCRESDVSGLARKSVVTRKSVRFSVVKVEPDGTGTAMVQLSKLTPPNVDA